MAHHYPALHSFPPFFTCQCHEATRAKQLEAWISIILMHCKYTKKFVFYLSQEGEGTNVSTTSTAITSASTTVTSASTNQTADSATPKTMTVYQWPLRNDLINRSLNLEAAQDIIHAMYDRSLATWICPTRCVIWWIPMDVVIKKIMEKAQLAAFDLHGTVMTAYELFEDFVLETDVHVPKEVWRILLDEMVKQSLVVLIEPPTTNAADEDYYMELGVKFL